MSHALLSVLVGSASFGCLTIPERELLIHGVTVSMTYSEVGADGRLQKGKRIEERWCVDTDLPLIAKPKDQSMIGLVDEAVMKAQKLGEGGDFIVDADIYVLGKRCATIAGTQAKLLRK